MIKTVASRVAMSARGWATGMVELTCLCRPQLPGLYFNQALVLAAGRRLFFMQSYKQLFTRFLQSKPARLHMAAHSHHAWPDCTEQAHAQAWSDAAEHIDQKWGLIFESVIPEAQAHIARQLSLPDPTTICFAPNTHEFVLRLHSCFSKPAKILTTDSEFHSFARQHQRWQEAGEAEVTIVAAEPFETFGKRFAAAVSAGNHDLVFLSQVFFNSGFFVDSIAEIADILRHRETQFVIDGYHAFMALPISLAAIADQAFFIGGGYKYAMAGEGVCFMHCPPGKLERPTNTGWFAGFAELEGSGQGVSYAEDGMRFAGATFDVSGLYRFNAVQRMLTREGLSVAAIHAHVQVLQEKFLEECKNRALSIGELIPGNSQFDRGHFLTFRTDRAASLYEELGKRDVIVDVRADRLRFGFGLYHDEADIVELASALDAITAGQ
jgi:kynureninase